MSAAHDLSPDLASKLASFVRSRNAHRSAKKEAEGYVSGKRVYNLKVACETEQRALLAIADWVEQQAREALGISQHVT